MLGFFSPTSRAMMCWAAMQELSADNERLRLSASAARETAARQADELSRLQRDNARMSSALVRMEPLAAAAAWGVKVLPFWGRACHA